METVFALSSGAPPAAIAILRISGPEAGLALDTLAGLRPEPRRATLCRLHTQGGELLDEALVLWMPGPHSATGEDCAELHCHGGRAVVAAIKRALAALGGLREAEPGEFTRRAFVNGRIDLAEAEGLADLLEAETEIQRASAMAMAGGALSRQADSWCDAVLQLSALVEAALDFSDEDDVAGLPDDFHRQLRGCCASLHEWLDRPRAERLREGYKVAIGGPPNIGKSTLFNALTDSEAAITSPIAGTTRDVIERSVALEGVLFSFVDLAGLREVGADEIEAIGIGRARQQLERADAVLWLGKEGYGPSGAIEVEAQIDQDGHQAKAAPAFRVSAVTGEGMDELRKALVGAARTAMPRPGEVALNLRQSQLIAEVAAQLDEAQGRDDLLLVAECLRGARVALDRLVGRASTEDMLDGLFGRFCIGK